MVQACVTDATYGHSTSENTDISMSTREEWSSKAKLALKQKFWTSHGYKRSSSRLASDSGNRHSIVKDGGVSPPKFRASDGNILILI